MINKPKLINNLSFVLHTWREKPILIWRSFFFFFLKLLNKPAIRGMDVAVTYHCNMRCRHCNIAGQIDPDRPEITSRDIIRAVRQLQKMGGFYVTFTGGEPLLAIDKIEAVIAAIGKKSMLYQLQTNGLLLDDTMCGHLKQIGIDNIQISFDDCHETHNWDEVIRIKQAQLAMLRKWGFDVIFTWLAAHETMAGRQLHDIIHFSNSNRVKIGLNFAVPQGRWEGRRNKLLTVMDSFAVRKISATNRHLYIDLQNNLFHFGCPAFSERLHINAYGDVQPCTFFQISFGNIRQQALKDIREKGLGTKPFSEYPDHCPPAENPYYIEKILSVSSTTRFPIHYLDFFPGSCRPRQGLPPEDKISVPENERTGHESHDQCVICGNPVSRYFFTVIDEVEYGTGWQGRAKACASCGLIHQSPLPSDEEALQQYPAGYIHYNPYASGIKGLLMKLYMTRTIKLLQALGARPGDRLLDIGCGGGEKLSILKNHLQLQAVGIEPSKKAARTAAWRFGLTVVDGFFTPERFEKDSFDFVRINHVIEHVSDPIALLDNIYSVLKPGGWLIGETENTNCLSFRLFGKFWALLHFPYHLLLFNKSTLQLTFSKSKFRHVNIEDLCDPPAWSLSLQNFLRRRQPIEKRDAGRMPGYTLITILCYPLTWVEKLGRNGAVVAFTARKPLSDA